MDSGYLAPVAGVAVADRADRKRPGGSPDSIRKDELMVLRDQVTRGGGPSPSGIDTLIENFDRVAGRGGDMTFDQFKAFAAENGVQLQVASARAAEERRTEVKRADAKQASDTMDVSLLSETELRTMVAKGDRKAVLELERRSEVRAESERAADTPRVNVYA